MVGAAAVEVFGATAVEVGAAAVVVFGAVGIASRSSKFKSTAVSGVAVTTKGVFLGVT
jgi:hypothetical protein